LSAVARRAKAEGVIRHVTKSAGYASLTRPTRYFALFK